MLSLDQAHDPDCMSRQEVLVFLAQTELAHHA